jgi:ribonucleoside-diphosphate reductase alpha chain
MPNQMSQFATNIMNQKYAHDLPEGRKETWGEIAHRVAKNVMKAVDAPKELVKEIETAIANKEFIPGGRYLYATGRPYHQTQNCLLLRAEDSREGWSDLLQKASMALMTGAGIGINYSALRAKGKPIRKTGGTASGPVSLMQMVNECARFIIQGGSRRAAVWAGLSWKHPDIHEFIHMKDWSDLIKQAKAADYNFPAPLDSTNISVCLDDEFFEAFNNEKHVLHSTAHSIYWECIKQMLTTGEPGFSIDVGKNAGEDLRNACSEVTSRNDSDICNLGSINVARVKDLEHMKRLVEIGTAFLIAGSVYSDVPYAAVDQCRTRNRRIGLGLMGLHEWLLKHGKKYGEDSELEEYLKVYATNLKYAKTYAKQWDLTVPIAGRAIAPTGTIGIVAETSTGIEPVFCVAYKRRYLKGDVVHYQYVVDPVAQRLINNSIPAEQIEDAYSLAENVERRVRFQEWIQKHVDHAVSSTINLPQWGSEFNNESKVKDFGNMLIKYLPNLRGITCYPDGARGGQPLTPVAYKTAIKHVGEVFVEQADVCSITNRGSCGA